MKKLALYLLERAELKKNLEELHTRIMGNLLVQEGDAPIENVIILLTTFEDKMRRYEKLVKGINVANLLPIGKNKWNFLNLMEAIAKRDKYQRLSSMYKKAADGLVPKQNPYSRSEIRFIPSTDAKIIRETADKYAKERREIDEFIQSQNWAIEVAISDEG